MGEVDLDCVHRLTEAQILQLMELYRRGWWSRDRKIVDVRSMLQHTDLIFGFVNPGSKDLVAFARVLSDQVYFALVLDVIVAPEYRNMGIGRALIETIKTHPILSQVEYLELCCPDDLKPFYRACGFSEVPGRMQIKRQKAGTRNRG